MPRFVDDVFNRWGAAIVRRQRGVLAATALLALIAAPFALYTLRHLDVNVFNQVDESLKRVRYLRESSTDFGGDFLAAVITIPDVAAKDPKRLAELKIFGDLLAQELSKVGLSEEDRAAWHERDAPRPWLRQVEARAGQGLEAALEELGREYPQAVLSLADVETIAAKFAPEALQKRLDAFVDEYRGMPTDQERMEMRRDPLKLWAEVRKELERRHKKARPGLAPGPEGYFLSPDGTTLLVLGRPVGIAQDLLFDRALLAACQRAENRAVEAFRRRRPAPQLSTALKGKTYGVLAEGERDAQLQVGFTGLPVIAFESEVSMRWDILATTTSSLIAVLLLFLAVYRRVRLVFFIGLTMALGVLFTLAIAAPVQGKLGVMGASFPCILLGMGVDYGIHLFSTFHALREDARLSSEAILGRTLRKCGPGILAASVTTMAAFFGIATTHFKGLAELGLLAGIGLGCAAVLMLSFFPALLLTDKRKNAGQVSAALRRATSALGAFHRRRRNHWIGLLAGLAVAGACAALIMLAPKPQPDSLLGVAFDSEFTHLRSLRVKAYPLRERIAERFGQGFTDIKVLVEGPDEATAFATAERVAENARAFIEKKELQPSGGILDLIPSPRRQKAVREALLALNVRACRERFLEAARKKFGARAERAFRPFLDRLDKFERTVRDAKILTVEKILDTHLAPLLALFARVDGKGAARRVRLVMNYFPGELLYPEKWYDRMAETLEHNPPAGGRIRVSAPRMVGFELKTSLFFDMEWISGLVAACVALLLVFTFRSLKRALWAALPLVFGFLFVLAGVAAAQKAGWDFALNYVNLMIFPVLLGSGIDYGVYLVFDAFHPRRPRLEEVLSGTGRGVLMCGLTTLAGFGSMIGGSFTGLISFGWTAILGYSGALFGALIVLPGVLGLCGVGRGQAAGQPERQDTGT